MYIIIFVALLVTITITATYIFTIQHFQKKYEAYLYKLINSVNITDIEDITTLRRILRITKIIKEKKVSTLDDDDIIFLCFLSKDTLTCHFSHIFYDNGFNTNF